MILHAKRLNFTCPITKKKFSINAEYDYEFTQLIEKLKE